MFTPLGFDHVVLRVRDQAASVRFYRDVLGCGLDRVNERISLVHLRFGDQFIDLVPASEPPPQSTDAQQGMDHFCLSIRCDDLDALAASFRERGVTVEGSVVRRYGAYGDGPSLYLRDPDGYKVELKPRGEVVPDVASGSARSARG
jgi:glyoxylase I family protein